MRAGPYWPGTAFWRHFVGLHEADGAQQLGALVADGVGAEAGAGLHGDGGHHLQQVVLDHVAQRAGLLIVGAAAFDADGFGAGDLDVVDVAAIPERLEDAVAEAEGQDVLDGFLAEVVIDAVDLGFVEDFVEAVAELAGAGEVVAEGLFDDEAAPAIALAPGRLRRGRGRCAAYWLGCVER